MRHVKAWTPAALVAAGIFYLSSRSTLGIELTGWASEVASNAVHFTEFALLAAAIFYGLKTEGMDREDARKLAVLLAIGFGVTDEIHQRFTPGRSSSPLDLIPDLAGAWVGVRIASAVDARRRKKKGRNAAYG